MFTRSTRLYRQSSDRLRSISRHLSSSMAPVNTKFDYLVIGGGSGGVASARRAASYGAKVLLVESKFDRLGGTCVNVGCVPKKVMWHAADLAEKRKHLKSYGLSATQDDVKYGDFDWHSIKVKRDAYVRRLNGIYKSNLIKENVDFVFGFAKFINSEGDVEVSLTGDQEIPFLEKGKEFKKDEKLVFAADKILLATGGEPIVPPNVEGKELGIVSDGFFDLEQQPKKVAVVGSGYIGTEFAGVFSSLGSETHIILRSDAILRHFDESIQENVTAHYVNDLGVKIHYKVNVSKIEKTSSGQKVHLTDGKVLEVDELIWTVGRRSLVDHIGLDKVNVKCGEQGHVLVDEYQQTNNPKIFSLGDVVGNVELTPVAIAAGRKLSNRLFSGKKEYAHDKLDYNFVPSVVFSHPEAGTIGLTTAEAKQKYGEENIKIYQSKFNSLYNAMLDSQDLKTATFYKLIVTGPEEKVIGLHIVGESSAEILQGFGVAVKMGATKADFDNCVAIHPTSAEELVTLK